MLHVDLSSRIRSRPPCHSESASAVPIYAALHIVIPNPLQRCHIRGPAHCHSESASAVPYTRPCTLSFRIRFSGEESAFPASRFQETRRAPCLATLSTWD